jgi:membrane fusion protein, multidrug efflux system
MSVNALAQLRSSASLRLRTPSLRVTLMVIVPALVAAVGLFLYLAGGRYVSTDNAYVGAQKVLITPEVSGKVMRVRSDFDNLKSMHQSLGKQIELARQSVAANQAEFDRKTSLLNNRISTPADLDKSRMALAVTKGLLEQLQQQEATVRNQLRGDVDLPIEKYPQFIEATVALQRAERDLANTVLRAPIAGIATQVTSIQMGRFLTAGMAVFSIIGTDNVWVDANPKETDLTYVRAGQQVVVTIDTFPARAWRGRVAAISPGTGAQFAILPPQNAAGNWIKIVQRVPLRIEFEPGQDLRRLRSGMSATVEIDTGRRGRLARLLGSSAVAQDPDQ